MRTTAFASPGVFSLQRKNISTFLGCETPVTGRRRGFHSLHPPPRARICANFELSKSLDPAAAASTQQDPDVVYSETQFRGFRCCYASAVAGSTPPDAPALVLVHGFGANIRHWRDSYAPLAARGFRVFGIDLLGFGKGDMPKPGTLDANGDAVEYKFEYWSAQLRQFCNEVVRAGDREGKDRPPIFFVANSIGSMVTMLASIEEPGLCSGQVFISPSLRQLNVRKRPWIQGVFVSIAMKVLMYKPIGAYFLNSLAQPDSLKKVLKKAYAVNHRVDDELVEILRAPALQPGALEVFLAFISYDDGPIPEDLLPQLDCRSLIIWGEQDSFEPFDDGVSLKHYATVEKFVSLPATGHCAHDERPEEVNALIADFVESQVQ